MSWFKDFESTFKVVRFERMATSATQDMEIDEFEDEDAIALELSSPLEKFRPARYLWVSHLAEQLWCEQRLEYSFTRPVKRTENLEDFYNTSPFKQDKCKHTKL